MSPLAPEIEKSKPKVEDPHRDLVRRVIRSNTFAKTERLSSFLCYVCDQTLKGRADDLNEQRIGEAVFGRSHDYDSSIDGIVRTQGSRLRQRLDRYFAEEGAGEPVRIVIPRGGYVPVFEPRRATGASAAATGAGSAESGQAEASPLTPSRVNEAPAGKRSLWKMLVVAAICVVVVLLLVVRFGPVKLKTRDSHAEVHPLWSHLFGNGERTLIVPGDSGLVIWEGLTKQKVNLAEFLKGDYRSAHSANSVQNIADDLSNRRYTSIVDLEAVQALMRIAATQKSDLDMRYARDLQTNDLKEYNIILVGAPEANPWVELYEPMMNFQFHKDPVSDSFTIINRSPRGKEPQRWDFSTGSAFAIVAYLPGLRGNGNGLLIGGTSMTGTESALDFISDDSQLLPFLKHIQRPDGSLPHFEVVLGTNYVSHSAVRSHVLAWRTLD
jgi:hypothetical protein